MALHPKGKKVVHYIPGPLHPKWHYIQKATTSHKPLHPTMLLHPTYHFITFATSSHMPLHPKCHFIPYATSSHRSLHPIGYFTPYTTSSHIRHMICHFIPSHIMLLHLTFYFIPLARLDSRLYSHIQ